MASPLADIIRPQKLSDFIGQKHLTGPNKPVRLAIQKKQLFSMIFWGPPGCGKTTLARIIAHKVGLHFFGFSAVSAGKKDLRGVIQSIEQGLYPKGSVVFLDEIHRFNKAQQDYLLPFVETGTITLIGATTENPSFEVIGPLLSRTRVFVLKELDSKEIGQIIERVLKYLRGGQLASESRNTGKKGDSLKVKNWIKLDKKTEDWLINLSAGDARQVITLLENAYALFKDKIKKEGKISLEILKTTLQSPFLRYDKAGEEHYNTISSFIKSMRASNVDAALYYLARMVAAGEDPLFIARRMVIFASEDIGMALPTALVVANAVFRACETIGYPECQENLVAGTVYLALAPKDRSAYNAYMEALADVKQYGNLPIPLHLRNPVTKLMDKVGYGKGYEMYPDKSKNLLPDKLKGKKYYKK
ncbi:MAG TPA: replication-associated recombination protein A [Candidatus Bathyarchaeia archaeon]|nr:replication-associated recombination protein A [Candidatus Bathyarchaeia archaeon]